MIKPIDLKKFTKNLTPIETPEIFTGGGSAFHPQGIASEVIFGPQESAKQKTTFSYIMLNTEVIHPALYDILKRLDRKIEKYISTESFFIVNTNGELIEVDDDVEGAVTGLSNFTKVFAKIKFRGGTAARDSYVKLIKKYGKDNLVFIDRIPVMPPHFRPIYKDENGQWTIDAINEIYVSILRKTLSIKTQEQKGILGDLFRYGIQRVVNQHHDFIKKKIEKKEGLIRSKLMGKRTDFSGRAVISTNPEIKAGEIGVPFRLIITLFEPFLVFYMLRSGRIKQEELEPLIKQYDKTLDYGPEAVQRIVKAINMSEDIDPKLKQLFWDACVAISTRRMVLAKRDPVLIPEGYQAYHPIVVDSETIQMCPLHVGKHNADFDGDAMAIIHPLSNESQKELADKASRIYASGATDSVTIELSKGMYIGLYKITKTSKKKNSPINFTDEDVNKTTDPYTKVVYRNKNTTAGRAIYNYCYPKDFPFFEGVVDKSIIRKHLDICQQKYSQDIFKTINNRLMEQGFKWATIAGSSFTLDSIELPQYILDYKKKLEGADPDTASRILGQAEKEIAKFLEGTGLGDIIESGSAKGYDQVMQVIFAKGLMSDISGEILPAISTSMSEGLDSQSFFKAGAGARAGMVGRAVTTADTGYLARRLVYFLNTVELHPTLKDCKTTKTIKLKVTDGKLLKDIRYRFVIQDRNLVKVEDAKIKIGDVIELRSPIYCKSPKICHACYGRSYERIATPYIGVSAGLNIGQAATQASMEKFHTGGAVKVIKKNMIEDMQSNNPTIPKDINKYIKQEENDLIAKTPITITIDLNNEYEKDKNYWIDEEAKEIKFAALIALMQISENEIYDIIIDYFIVFDLTKLKHAENNTLQFNIAKNEVLFKTTTEDFGATTLVRYLDRLIGGRDMLKGEVHLLQKIYTKYKQITSIALVHLEILCSQILRDSANPSIPARLGKNWNPVLINLKKTIYNEGFLQGLAFENLNEALRSGMISEQTEPKSILEKVLIGDDE